MSLTPTPTPAPGPARDAPPCVGRERKRVALLGLFAAGGLGTALTWWWLESRGVASPVWRGVFAANVVFHPLMFALVMGRRLPQRLVDLVCLLFATAVGVAGMVATLYFPAAGEGIGPSLYLWIPLIHVFAFTVAAHKSSLAMSLGIGALFLLVSLPYLLHWPPLRFAGLIVQLHLASALLIAALHFFSGAPQRLPAAPLTMDELATLSHTDELTGLPNGRRISQVVDYELARFERYGRGFALIMIGIDHFRDVNERLGSAMGDRALQALATRARQTLRDGDTLGRWGGDQFVIVLPEAGLDDALRKAHALCAHVGRMPLLDDLQVRISGGVASVTPADTVDSLFHRADAALHAAKQRGRNRAESVVPA